MLQNQQMITFLNLQLKPTLRDAAWEKTLFQQTSGINSIDVTRSVNQQAMKAWSHVNRWFYHNENYLLKMVL